MRAEKIKIKEFDLSEYLKTDEDVLEFLQASLEEEDPKIFISALKAVLRLKGQPRAYKKLTPTHPPKML